MTVATRARSPLQDRLAAARRANAGTRQAIAPAATAGGAAPLSPAQARLWFLAQLEPGSSAYNAPSVLRLRGALDSAALLAALRDLAERHPVLRSVIGERDGEPVAVELAAGAVPLSLLDVPAAGLPAALRAEAERPFALDAEPPMRAAILRLRDDEHVLALTLHHIATDAWSENLLLADLEALYAARLGLADPPAPPAIRYGDYAAWLTAGHDDAAAAVEWWADRLAGLAPVLDLPADRARPATADWSAGEVPVTLPAPLVERLRVIAAEERCTPFMVLLAAWQALLGRICGTDDVPIAVPESGRRHAETEGVVGCFINTVVVRTDTSGDPTGRELIDRVRDGALESFAHAAAPFEQVVARINPDRAVGATPLAQVQLNVYDEPPARRFAGLDVERHEAPPETAKTDLSLTLPDGGTAFRGGLVYRRALFDERSAARIAGWYVHLLEGMLADVDRPVGAVPLEPAPGPLLTGPARAWPVERPVHALFEQHADADPGATAIVAADGVLTYGELERSANRLAHRLRAAGVEPDEPVGVLLEPSTALACALLGIQKAGGGYLPMDTTYPPGRIAAILEAAGARTLLTTAELADRGAGRTVLALDDPATLAGQPETRPVETAGPDHLAHVIFTSGSTGAPKGVAVSRRSVASYLHGVLERLGDVAGGSFAMVSTPAADFGLTPVFGALTTGGCVHLVDREVATDAAAFARYLAEHRVDVLKCVPSHLELLATHGALAEVLPRRLLILAGEACPWSLVERVRAARPQLRVQNHYGHTESTMISLVCEVDEVPPERRSGVVPLGSALANVTGFVVDRAGRALPAGVPGELVVAGPGVARGYVGRPDLTAERFVPDPQDGTRRCYRSGDRIVVRADGTVDFLGRVDDQVKIRGYRVEPGEVVVALRALAEVGEAVVLPVGEGAARKLAAWLVGTDVDVASVRARLRERLPDYMVPASFVVLDRLPLTPNGKVDRAALPAPEPDRPAGLTAPSSAAEQRVAAAWAAVLGVEEIGAEDDFFALGGDSFAAVRAVRAIDPSLRVIDLFTHPTVRGLGAFLDARDAVPAGDKGLLHRLGGPPAGVAAVATLVGVPYGGGSAAAFQPLATPLAERGIELLAVELPGHDPARPEEAPLGLAELVDRLAAEIAERVTGPVALYGHCVGTALATALARRLEADGRTVLGVVAAGSFPAARLPGRLSARAARAFGDRWVSDRLYRDALRATGGLLDDMDEAATDVALRAMRHDAHEAEEWFGRELAASAGPRLRAPILCLVGERDRMTELYQERHREWGAFAERVALATIPQAGHYFLRHQATAVAETLAGRLADWAAGRLPAAVRDVPVDSRGLRAFYTVAGGQLVSNIGSALTAFALGVWAYQRSGRIIDLALVIMLAQLPVVLVTPLGGALADRLDRRRIMLACDAVAGLATLALVALLLSGGLALWNACVVVTVIAVVTALQQPAWLAAISQLAPKPYLPQANALANLGLSLGAVVAPLAGGVLIATLGLSAVVAVDVVTFGVGIVTLLLVRFPDRLAHTREESFRTALGGGWRFITRRRPLVVMVVFVAAANYFNAVLWVATAPLVLSFAGPAALGVVTAVGGVGAALGGLAVLVWGGTRRRATGMVGFVVGAGLGAILMGLWASVAVVAIGLALRWGSMAIGNAHWLALIQVKVGQELQGRVLAANLMLVAAMEPLGFLTADPLAGLMSHAPGVGPGRGVAALVVVCGVFLTVWGLLGLRYRPLRHMEDALPDAVPGAEIDADLDRAQARADLAWAV